MLIQASYLIQSICRARSFVGPIKITNQYLHYTCGEICVVCSHFSALHLMRPKVADDKISSKNLHSLACIQM